MNHIDFPVHASGAAVVDRDGFEIATISPFVDPHQHDAARWLAAALNACQGLGTERLESLGARHDNPMSTLLAALDADPGDSSAPERRQQREG